MSILKKGDTVGIIAPSSSFGDDADITPACDFLHNLGLKTVLAENIYSSHRYMAGTDEQRAAAVNSLISAPEIKALFCLRGGAGATRILELLDFSKLQKNPKPIIGLSDSTALQNAAFTLARNPSLTGFLPLYDMQNGKINEFMAQELRSVLFAEQHNVPSGKCLSSGTTTGIIIGGCLSVFNLLCGTKYFPNLKGKILLLEDTGEKTYRIDLMLTQLKQQANFNQLRGIIFGAFNNCKIQDRQDGDINDCIADFTQGLNIPVITDFAYGHIPQRHIIPLGVKVKLISSPQDCQLVW